MFVHSAAEMRTKFHIMQAKLIMSIWCFTVHCDLWKLCEGSLTALVPGGGPLLPPLHPGAEHVGGGRVEVPHLQAQPRGLAGELHLGVGGLPHLDLVLELLQQQTQISLLSLQTIMLALYLAGCGPGWGTAHDVAIIVILHHGLLPSMELPRKLPVYIRTYSL